MSAKTEWPLPAIGTRLLVNIDSVVLLLSHSTRKTKFEYQTFNLIINNLIINKIS